MSGTPASTHDTPASTHDTRERVRAHDGVRAREGVCAPEGAGAITLASDAVFTAAAMPRVVVRAPNGIARPARAQPKRKRNQTTETDEARSAVALHARVNYQPPRSRERSRRAPRA
jgi:hypothetical protein